VSPERHNNASLSTEVVSGPEHPGAKKNRMVASLRGGAGACHSGSRFIVALVKERSARTVRAKMLTAEVESLAPGGSSMKGMNFSGNPGMVQPIQMPPTFGQPRMPAIQPRLPTCSGRRGPSNP
jgi:hypothetical protein